MTLIDKIKGASEAPGVYLFKDQNGRVVYIGKAVNLRNRLNSYLKPADEKSRFLMNQARDLETIITASDIEALTLEESLIKLHKPKYNIRLKDDKKYPYLKITIKDKFPRILFTRDIRPDQSLLFGPYTNARYLRLTRDALCRIFKLASCQKDLTIKHQRACLEYSVKRCLGPCVEAVSPEEYERAVSQAVRFLRGHSTELMNELEKQMWQYAREEKFEAASRRRDQLRALQNISQRQQTVTADDIDRDIIGFARSRNLGCACLMRIRENRLEAKENFRLAIRAEDEEADLIDAFLRLIYTHVSYLPDEIVIPRAGSSADLLEKWFRRRGFATRIRTPERAPLPRLMAWACRNAEAELSHALVRQTVPHALIELQNFLKTPNPLRWIEAFDISNLGEKWAVGASVCFKDGKPFKAQYRRYRIRRVPGQNDLAMINEIVDRRLKDLHENQTRPDILLIDGGRLQQNAANCAVQQINLDLPVYALAKRRGQLFRPDGKIVSLPSFSRSGILLKRIQDEVHRFAVTYHRRLRQKQLTSSELDRIPGIGHRRKMILLNHFGSLDRLKKASEEDISKIPLIGLRLARLIYESLHS